MNRRPLALSALQSHLEQTFYPPAAVGLDAIFRLMIGSESLVFQVTESGLRFAEGDSLKPDATFFFEDVDIAWALLSGRSDAFSAFMQGRFSADGHLMWAFTLMSMFQSESLPDNPVE